MTGASTLSKDRRTLTVRVPFAIKKRGGRKLVVAPAGMSWSPPAARIDNTMIKAIARAHRWKRLLEGGHYASVAELAAAEKINESYVCRILRLTLLAPDVVEQILAGSQPPELHMDAVLKPFSVVWQVQRRELLMN
ncbi:MAG: hypothetical protein KDK89_23145 [Alphaproteobacteria bacterium]|nr:hypothetical protein [Alphaproteobacteria bacterium]